MALMTGADAAYYALRALGVEHVFGIVSVHNIPIYDAILRHGGISPISVRHEQGAVHAADAYARATGKLGVAITSTGPGAANAMGGLFEADFASSPVLMLTGQIESSYYGKGKGFLHEAERQADMLRPLARRVESVRGTADVAAAIIRTAIDIQTGRPRPGVVEIPIDLQYATADVDIDPEDPFAPKPPRLEPALGLLEQAAETLRGAQQPLIWAGGGVITSGAAHDLQRLAEALQSPVLTSANGRGSLPEDHPLCMGPITGDPAVQQVIDEADVVLALGTRFQSGATRQWTLTIPGRLIHIDADPAVLGRNYHPAIGIVGDAQLAVSYLADKLADTRTTPSVYTTNAIQVRDTVRATIREQIGPDYCAIMDTIRELLPRDGNIVRDATVPAYLWGNRLIPILEPRTSMQSTSAAIGPGMALSLGAAIGSGRKTVLIQGDGGFMLSIGELATAVQFNVPVIICIFNDRGYGVLRSIQARTFEGRQNGVDLATPDFAALAKAMGMRGEAVTGVDNFREAFARAIKADAPVLLDIDMAALQPMRMMGAPRRETREAAPAR